jgi:hypothetical protein
MDVFDGSFAQFSQGFGGGGEVGTSSPLVITPWGEVQWLLQIVALADATWGNLIGHSNFS